MDNLRDPDRAVAVRYGYFIYYGRPDPYSSRNCYYSSADERHWWAENLMNA